MDINELISELQKLKEEGKGSYKVRAHNIDLNTANGDSLFIQENEGIGMGRVFIDNESKTITFGEYYEYYSY